jgi:hypothetical protein
VARLALYIRKPGVNKMPTYLDMILDQVEPGVWYAVSNTKAVRNQPMALFRLKTDAEIIGSRMILDSNCIKIERLEIPALKEIEQSPVPPPTITIIEGQ